MTDRKRPGMGLAIVFISAFIFWGSVGAFIGYSAKAARVNHVNPKDTCERLIEYGWDVEMSECVTALMP